MHAILVQATPMDGDGINYGVECSICGPVVVVEGTDAADACTLHMTEHGAKHVVETEG